MPPNPNKAIFISHASADDAFVKQLRHKLELHGLDVWVDSRNLRGGDILDEAIAQAIREARQVLVVLSPNTVNSPWVRKEIHLAETCAASRSAQPAFWKKWTDKLFGQPKHENLSGKPEDYRVIPLLLPGMEPTSLLNWFNKEPVGVKIALEPGKLQEALPHILAALGERAPDDAPAANGRDAQPVAELLLELRDPKLTQLDNGSFQISAEAELIHTPADITAQSPVNSKRFRFVSPIGQIDQDELRWYLEKYYLWPAGEFRKQAERTEAKLPQWGKALFDAVLGKDPALTTVAGWISARAQADRRFSVRVDASLLDDAPAEEQSNARQAASRLISLPWELLHDGKAYLSEGAYPVHVRRRLPNYDNQLPRTTTLPIRILLLSPRPEQEGVVYLDHRASAKPLVDAVESLGELAELEVLNPPTLAALGLALKNAYDAKKPFHVLHFDGHGVYDPQHGLGALCFEDPQDCGELEYRRMELVHADTLAALLRDYRIPLVFLEACQTAHSEADPSASVAARLLQVGVSSVVAMSHSVLVETARRFVTAFYQALAHGERVGQAMLAGQTVLMRDSYRGTLTGAGGLHLHDWFVPILYQEQHDPQLFTRLPTEFAAQLQAQQRSKSLGELPPAPPHQFIGRSCELLKLERLLEQQPYAVIRGMGGEGKTSLAVELARWLVRSQRFERCAFISLEQYSAPRNVLDALGRQLLPNYSVAEYGEDLARALQPITRVLENSRTLLVLDNMESLLAEGTAVEELLGLFAALLAPSPPAPLPRGGEGSKKEDVLKPPRPRGEEWGEGLKLPSPSAKGAGGEGLILPSPTAKGAGGEGLILPSPSAKGAGGEGLILPSPLRGGGVGGEGGKTRLLFTTREPLPYPFDHQHRVVKLGALSREEAIELVTQVMHKEGLDLKPDDAGNTPEEITNLVEAVHCHARALVLVSQALSRRQGVTATTATVQRIMVELDARYPKQREKSLFASVELSLRRLNPTTRALVNGLAVFHDGGIVWAVAQVLGIEFEQAQTLLAELVAVGLAEKLAYDYHRLDPALCPYLGLSLNQEEAERYRLRWQQALSQLVDYLYQQRFQDAQLAARLTLLELPNLLAFIQQLALNVQAGHAEAAALTNKAGSIEQLLANLNRPVELALVVARRQQAARHLGDWSHARFEHERLSIERLLQQNAVPQAYAAAQTLLQQCQQAGEQAYPGADYDLAMANYLLGRVLHTGGAAAQALPFLVAAQQRFEYLGERGERMASVTLAEQGNCLQDLGQLDAAAEAYQEGIRRAEKLDDVRGVAVKKGQLATVRLLQNHYAEALQGNQEALALFGQLNEPGMMAVAWHQIGIVHRQRGDYPQAEQAYRHSLSIKVQQGNRAGEASSLAELGILYDAWNRPEQAVAFCRQAMDIYQQLGDLAGEGRQRNNLADTLIKLGRYDEARPELLRAIECKQAFGHAATPWNVWNILHDLELASGNPAAARDARRQALQAYLAYRRDGGENHSGAGRLAEAVWQAMQQSDRSEIGKTIAQLLERPDLQEHHAFLHALQTILAGGREPSLAEDESLSYDMAAELAWLLERL